MYLIPAFNVLHHQIILVDILILKVYNYIFIQTHY